MTDLLTLLATLRRPRLLMSSARFGAQTYNRAQHLARVLKSAVPATHGAAITRLMAIEDGLNDKRKSGDANYTPAQHVDVMIALVAEAGLLAAAKAPAVLTVVR